MLGAQGRLPLGKGAGSRGTIACQQASLYRRCPGGLKARLASPKLCQLLCSVFGPCCWPMPLQQAYSPPPARDPHATQVEQIPLLISGGFLAACLIVFVSMYISGTLEAAAA